MPDSTLPKPTPPAAAVDPASSPAEPLKMTAQGEIVADKSNTDAKPDDMTVPPSAFQSAPPAPLPMPSPPPAMGSTSNPALVTPPPKPDLPMTSPISSPTMNNASSPGPTSTSGSIMSPVPVSTPPTIPSPISAPATPPPATLTALSSMASAAVPPTPPPSPTAPAPNNPKTQPVLATAPKKSLSMPLMAGLAAVVLLVIGLAAFFLLRPKTSPVTSKPAATDKTAADETSGTGTNAGTAGTAGGSGSGSDKPGGGGTTTTSSGEPIVLEYWGLWEPEDLVRDVLTQYQTSHPGISVRYTKQSYQDYRERLQTAVASGNGPDLFRFHASWVPMLKNELSPMPATIMSPSEFSNTFFPIATTQLQQNGQIVGMPLMYDGLVLYYNKDIFKTAGVEPPQTWADVRTLAGKLAIKNSTGGLQRGGIAMGNVANVEHFSDILGVLLLQNGADLTRPNSNQTRDALLFYTNFVKVDKVWDDQLPSSTVAFARGDVAMMFAPSWRAHDIAAQNPTLQFGTVPLPKLSENRLAWATYWAEGVSQQSKHKQEAWVLLKYLSSSEVLKSMYAKAGGVRSFGEIYPRKDISGDLASTEVIKSVLEDAPYAQNWYLNSYTHDNGLNDKLIQYYTDAVNGILTGKKPEDVLVTLEQGTAQVLGQYNVGLTL